VYQKSLSFVCNGLDTAGGIDPTTGQDWQSRFPKFWHTERSCPKTGHLYWVSLGCKAKRLKSMTSRTGGRKGMDKDAVLKALWNCSAKWHEICSALTGEDFE
jgi:hypothetical protein